MSKGFPRELTFKPSLEEYRGVGQEKDIPGKMNCLCKGFQAGRYFTGHRNGKEACLDGEIGKWTIQECVKFLDFILRVMRT